MNPYEKYTAAKSAHASAKDALKAAAAELKASVDAEVKSELNDTPVAG